MQFTDRRALFGRASSCGLLARSCASGARTWTSPRGPTGRAPRLTMRRRGSLKRP